MDIDQLEKLYINARAVGALDRHIGARLRSRRIMRQMSEQWLADALGLRPDELEAMEIGAMRIGPRRLAFIGAALDVADRYFFLDFLETPDGASRRPGWLRDVDCWFRDRVAPYENLLLSVAKDLIGSKGAARDLVHDVYAQVLVGDRWRTIENPKAYLRKSVVHAAYAFLAKSRIVPLARGGDVKEDVKDELPGPDVEAEQRDHLRRVLAALNKLPPKSRRVMIMRKVQGLSGPEIARRLGISLKGVEIHLTRGMVALNKHLEAEGVGSGLNATIYSQDSTADTSIAD